MKKKWITRLTVAALLLTMLPTAALAAQTTPADITYATNPNRIVQTVTPVQNGSKNIDLQVTTTGDGAVYTMLMKTADYAKITSISTITPSNYNNITVLSSTKYWHSTNQFDAAGTATLNLTATKGTDHNLEVPIVAENSKSYHQSYTFLVFDNVAGTQTGADYTVGTFRVDSEGFLQRDSYMVRYMKNGASAGGTSTNPGNMPGYQITDWGAATTLSGNVPTRVGYTFLGWDKDGALLGTDPNAAAASTKTPAYEKAGSYPAPEGDHNPAADVIASLYAIWKPVKADFAEETMALSGAQVGKSFDSSAIQLEGTSATDTVKSYTVTGDTKLPAGLSVQAVDKTSWKITGTPTTHSDGKPVTVTIQVQDNSNKTTDTITVTFDKVEKGEQPKPDATVDTGLTSKFVDDKDEITLDGRLVGFYSLGQESKKDDAGVVMTDGTGTYTNYYLSKGMIYEYRPIKVGGADLTYAPEDEAASWREIPATKAMYGATPEGWALFEASLGQGATTRYKTTIANKGAKYEAQTNAQPWADTYGAIRFEGDLPVVTGLSKDDVYQIRFRANETYTASEPTLITVGGAAASSGPSGYSVLFNLMGGKVFKVTTTPSDVEGEEPVVTEEDVTEQLFGQPMTGLKAGDMVTLPTLTLAANETLEYRKDGNTFAGFYDGKNTYTPDTTWSFTMPAYSVGLAAMWSGGAADPGDFTSVVFYDWNAITLLGSTVISKSSTAEEVQTQMKLFGDALAAPQELRDQYQTSNGTANSLYYPDNDLYPLTAKKGYSFGKWIDFNSEEYTNYGWAVAISNNTQVEMLDEPADFVLPSDLSEGLIVKAAYTTNADMEALMGDGAINTDRHYTVSLEANNRFSSTPNYSVTARAERNRDAVGVPRTRGLALRVIMTTTAGVQIYSLIPLDNQDSITAEIVPNTNIRDVEISVVDVGGVSNWVNGTSYRSDALIIEQDGTDGFVILGNVGYINQELAAGTTASVAAAFYTGAGLDTTNPHGQTGGNAAQRRTQAWKNMLAAWQSANPEYAGGGGYKVLSQTELQKAIDTGGYVPD